MNQVLVQAGLIASENQIQAELVQSALAQSSLSAEKQKAILIETGLIDRRTGEIITTKACTKEELLNALATKGVTGANAEAIVSALGLTGANEGLSFSFEVLAGSVKQTMLAMAMNPMTWIMAIPAIIYGAVKAYDALTGSEKKMAETHEKSKQALEKSKETYSDTVNELKTLREEIKKTTDRIEELNSKDSPSLVEEEEISKLQKTNDELERELRIKNAIARQELKSAADDAEKVITEKSEAYGGQKNRKRGSKIDATNYYLAEIKKANNELEGLYGKRREIEENYSNDPDQFMQDNEWKINESYINGQLDFIEAANKKSAELINELMEEDDSLYDSNGNVIEGKENLIQVLEQLYTDYDKYTESLNSNTEAKEKNSETDLTPSVTFNEAFNNPAYKDTKEELLDLAKAGELTPETLSSTEEYNKLLTQTQLSAEDACKQINQMVSAIERLDYTASGLSSLTDLYKQANEEGFVDIESLSGLDDAFKGLDSYNEFVTIVGSGTHSMAEMQQSFNKLTSEYLEHTKVLDGLNESNKELYIQQLKTYGISNAEDVVCAELNRKFVGQKFVTDKLNITMEEFSKHTLNGQFAMLKQKDAAEEVSASIADLRLTEIDYNKSGLDVSGKIAQLEELAVAYGLTGTMAQKMNDESHWEAIERQERNGASTGQHRNDYTEYDYQKAAEELREKIRASLAKYDYTPSYNGGSDYQKELSEETNKATDEAGKSKEVFDWIETRINRLKTIISELGETASDTFKSLAERAGAYGNEISKVTEEIQLQKDAYSKYMEKANSVGLSEEWASKIRDGSLDISEITDDTLKTQINDYQTWYDKAQDCLNTVNDLEQELAQLNIDRLQLSVDKAEYGLEKFKSKADRIQNKIDNETRVTKTSDYNSLDSAYRKQIKYYTEQNSLLIQQQQYVEKGSEKWIELQNAIRDNDTAVSELKQNIKENVILRIQIKFDKKTYIFDRLEKVYDEIQDKISLKDTLGQSATQKDYNSLNKNIAKQIKNLQSQNKTYAELQKHVQKGSKAWNEYKASIDDNNSSIRQLTQSMAENSKAKAELNNNKSTKKTESIDSSDELINAKIDNTVSYKKQNSYINSKIGNIKKRQAAYDKAVKDNKSGLDSAKKSINRTKSTSKNRKVLAKIKSYVKLGKEIPSSVIETAMVISPSLGQKCTDYNAYLTEYETSNATAKLYKETSKQEKADLAQEKSSNIEKYYQNKQSVYQQRATQLNSKIDTVQAQGYKVSEGFYNKLIANEKKNNTSLITERNRLVKSLSDSVADGSIKKYSSEWYDMCRQIDDVTNSINESSKSLVEYENQLRQIKWDNFDYLEERISQITSESDFMINQLSRKDLTDDEIGGITDEGKAVNALHLSNYNAYKQQQYDYKHQIDKINKELEKDPYDTALISRKEELVKAYEECINGANEEKYAVIELYTQGYEALKNKIADVISEYEELLDVQKNTYDYQQTIADKTKQIATIRKQLDAYRNDMSEETRANVQKLQVSLEDAEKDLKDTQYDKYISDTKDILGNLQDNLSDDIDNIIKNMADNFSSLSKDISRYSADAVGIIKNEMKGLGYSSTDEFNTILNGTNIVTGTKQAISDTKEFQQKMLEFADKQVSENDTKTAENKVTQSDGKKNLESDLKKAQSDTQNAKDALENAKSELDIDKKRADKAEMLYSIAKQTLGKDSSITKNNKKMYLQAKSDYEQSQSNYNNALEGYNQFKMKSDVMEYLKKYLSVSSTSRNKLSDLNKVLYDNYGERILSDNEVSKLANYLGVNNSQKKSGNLYKKLKKLGINGFQSGSKNIPYEQLALLAENGQEIQFDKSQGMLKVIGQGDKIFTSEMSENLWKLAQMNPVQFTSGINVVTPTLPKFERNVNSGDVNINMGGIVMNGVNDPQEFTEELNKNLATNPKTIKILQNQTVGSLSKNYNSLGARRYL